MSPDQRYSDHLASLVEARLPLRVETGGSLDDWQVIGPAMLAAATKHLRVIEHLQTHAPSAVIGWQLVRSTFEYTATFAWVAADPETHAKGWLKYDFDQRRKLDDDLVRQGLAPLLEPAFREETLAYEPELTLMPNLADRARDADARWEETIDRLIGELGGELPADYRRFRTLYDWIYRNGSRFIHPSSHVVQAFTIGEPPHLEIGSERPSDRDFALVAMFTLAVDLAIAEEALPTFGVTRADAVAALA